MSKKILFSLDRGLPGDTKYGASLSLTINDEYVISGQLLDQNGDPLGEEQTLDLPLESIVVDGFYDSENKALILTLDNGNTISIPIADLINGLQAEITPENKLSADLVDDSSTENKFVTQEEKDEIARSANLNLENGEGDGSIKLEGNTVSGQKGVGFGHNNTVQADRAFATGGGNIIRYDGQTQNGYMGFASGQNNYVSGRSASAIGEQLQAKYGGQLVVGKANLNKPDTLFEVGNGEILFINVSSKPSWQEIISNPIYYISNGSGGFTKITENNITEAQYDNLLISEIYVLYDGGRSNAFEVTNTGIARANYNGILPTQGQSGYNQNNLVRIRDLATFAPTPDLSGYVQKSTTIAGVDLQDNITATELKNALNVSSTLSGSSVPTTATVGALGQVYIDTTNHIPYMCVDIDNGTYTWVAIAAVSLDYSSTN